MDDIGSVSGSLNEENTSGYGSQEWSSVSGCSDEGGSASEGDHYSGPLIHFSDVQSSHVNQHRGSEVFNVYSNDLGELMLSKNALESWLEENPNSSRSSNKPTSARSSSARISVGDIANRVKPKFYKLLDPANGNGLSVDYIFSSEMSIISPLLVCVEVSSKICLVEDESNRGVDSCDQVLEMTEFGDIS